MRTSELTELLAAFAHPGCTTRECVVYQLRPPNAMSGGSAGTVARWGEDAPVSVWWKGHHVGNLDHEKSMAYAPVITALWDRDFAPEADGEITIGSYQLSSYLVDSETGAGQQVSRQDLQADYHLYLAEPHMVVPVNLPPPAPHVLLPHQAYGLGVQTSFDYQDNRAPYFRPERASSVFVTLHAVSGKTNLIEVRADGHPVGILTAAAAKEIRPVLAEAERHGLLTAARAVILGNHMASAVEIHCQRVSQLPPSWIADCTGSGVLGGRGNYGLTSGASSAGSSVLAPPTGWQFCHPPQWPVPPVGWQPPRGWEPDPSWELPPPDWQYWRPTWNLPGCAWEDPRAQVGRRR